MAVARRRQSARDCRRRLPQLAPAGNALRVLGLLRPLVGLLILVVVQEGSLLVL